MQHLMQHRTMTLYQVAFLHYVALMLPTKPTYFGVPLTHVIGQKLHVLALVDHHLLWNELKDGVLITVSSPVLFHFVQLSSHLLGLIANSTCLQQAVVAFHSLFPKGVAPVIEHTMIQRKG